MGGWEKVGGLQHGFIAVLFCFLEMYVNEVQTGQTDPVAEPVIIKETPGTAFVDGRNGIGMVCVKIGRSLHTYS